MSTSRVFRLEDAHKRVKQHRSPPRLRNRWSVQLCQPTRAAIPAQIGNAFAQILMNPEKYSQTTKHYTSTMGMLS